MLVGPSSMANKRSPKGRSPEPAPAAGADPMLSHLFGWPVVGAVVVLLFGTGISAMYGDDYAVAESLYFAAVLLLAMKVWKWEETKKLDRRARGVAVVATCLVAIIVFGALVRWTAVVAKRHSAKTPAMATQPSVPATHEASKAARGGAITNGTIGPPEPEPRDPRKATGLKADATSAHNIRHRASPTVPLARDVVSKPVETAATIRTIVIESRLTCTLKPGAALPPATVDWWPVGDGGVAFLEGPSGRFRLQFVTPVVFRRQDDDRIVVVNQFAAAQTSEFLNRPIDALDTITSVIVPIQTVTEGKSLATMTLIEVTITVNGRGPWYYSYPLNSVPFEEGPQFTIPVKGLRARVE